MRFGMIREWKNPSGEAVLLRASDESVLAAKSKTPERIALGPIQRHYLEHYAKANPRMMLHLKFFIEMPFDENRFKTVCELLVNQHESLCTTYGMTDGDIKIRRVAPGGIRLEEVRLGSIGAGEAHRHLHDSGAEAFNGISFLALQAAFGFYVVFTADHICGDVASMAIILKDLTTAYQSICNGGDPLLPPNRGVHEFNSKLCDKLDSGEGEHTRNLIDVMRQRPFLTPAVHPETELSASQTKRVLDSEEMLVLESRAKEQGVRLTSMLSALQGFAYAEEFNSIHYSALAPINLRHKEREYASVTGWLVDYTLHHATISETSRFKDVVREIERSVSRQRAEIHRSLLHEARSIDVSIDLTAWSTDFNYIDHRKFETAHYVSEAEVLFPELPGLISVKWEQQEDGLYACGIYPDSDLGAEFFTRFVAKYNDIADIVLRSGEYRIIDSPAVGQKIEEGVADVVAI